MGDSMRSTVRKAARLAVYEEIIMRVKNHQMAATMRVDTALEETHKVENNLSLATQLLDTKDNTKNVHNIHAANIKFPIMK